MTTTTDVASTVPRAAFSPYQREIAAIREIFTLGPQGTNCEEAARYYLRQVQAEDGKVHLFETLETAVEALPDRDDCALLGCIVYPALHELVFENVTRLRLVDTFVLPTLPMVLATNARGAEIEEVVTHPAPVRLLHNADLVAAYASSNAEAARLCAGGAYQACITTARAAADNGLDIVRDYGPIDMGFSIHVRMSPGSTRETPA